MFGMQTQTTGFSVWTLKTMVSKKKSVFGRIFLWRVFESKFLI